jgi:hypothetical protein
LPTYTITSADDIGFKEWTACRDTIGKLDTILVDLRKVGFSFITALLSAGAFLSFLGISTSKDVPAPPIPTRAAPFVAIMVLVLALFFIDTYFEVLLSGAVERALDLEAQTDPPVRLTKYISVNASLSRSTAVTLVLYLLLLLAACGLGVLGAIAATSTTGNATITSETFEWNPVAFVILGLGVVFGALMLLYWRFIGLRTGVHTNKPGRAWRPGEGL